MVHKREASRLPNSVCVRPSWQPVSATPWWCKWGMWPAARYGFWHPAETSMGLTHVFFSIIALASHPQMSGNTKRNPFCFLASEQRVWLWSPRWEMQRPKKILHLQTTVNRRIDKSQNKCPNVIQDAWGRTISDQNVETRIGRIYPNCHSVSSVGAQVFEQVGEKIAGPVGANMQNCWLNEPSFYCRQFARYYENRTCRTKRAPLHWLTRYDNTTGSTLSCVPNRYHKHNKTRLTQNV